MKNCDQVGLDTVGLLPPWGCYLIPSQTRMATDRKLPNIGLVGWDSPPRRLRLGKVQVGSISIRETSNRSLYTLCTKTCSNERSGFDRLGLLSLSLSWI